MNDAIEPDIIFATSRAGTWMSQILDSITDGVIVLDPEWRCVYVNQMAALLTQKQQRELLGKSLWAELPELMGSSFEFVGRRAIADQTTTEVEACYPTLGGQVNVRFSPFAKGLSIQLRTIASPALPRASDERPDLPPAPQPLDVDAQGETEPEDNAAEEPLEWANEALRHIKARFRSMTDLRRTEQNLRESEERFRATFNQAAVGIVQASMEGNFIQVNPAMCLITGYSREELEQMRFQEITHPEDLDADLQQFQRLLSREIPSFTLEKRYFRKDTSIVWAEVTVSMLFDDFDRPRCTIGIVQDVTERKRVEETLRYLSNTSNLLSISLDYEDTLQQVAQLPVPFLADWCIVDIFNKEGSLQRMPIAHADLSKAGWANQLQQYVPDPQSSNLIALTLRTQQSVLITKVTPELLATHVQDAAHQQLLQAMGLESILVVPLLARERLLGALTLVAARPGRNYTDQDLAVAEDVARRAALAIDNARLYQASRQSQKDLERAIEAERQARAKAESANRIKDEFLAVLSHELRTPLNPILGWVKLLRTRPMDADRNAYALETIERNARLQTQLIEDLLDVSRILQGKLKLETAAVNLVSTIGAAIDTVRLSAEAKSIQLKFLVDSTPPAMPQWLVSGDTNRLQQVFWNLFSNAVKFTPDGGQVEIRLSAISCASAAQPTYAQIQVVDTGQGIQPEFLPHVFEYFRQADSSTTRTHGGLGLGLAIVYHLIGLHGGSICAESAGEGLGATFTVQLPLLPAKVLHPHSLSSSSSPVNSPLLLDRVRILLVEDEPDTREFFNFLLEQQGAQVTAVDSATEALNCFVQAPPDVLISDIGIPEMDGYALIRQIRNSTRDRGEPIPAIALTAYASEADQQRAYQAGFQYHLAKPVEPDALIDLIVSLIHPSRS